MYRTYLDAYEILNRAMSRWRLFCTGFLAIAVLGIVSTLDAKRPPKDPPNDPDPPVEVEPGVIYYGWGWGNDPQEFWKMDSNGTNRQHLFTVEVSNELHRYNAFLPSK